MTTPVLHQLGDLQPQAIRWLWPGYLPCGKLTLIDGDPGLGKSFLTLDLAARISTGRPFPVGEGAFAAGNVLLISCEDGLRDTILPRLAALGANPRRVFAWQGCVLDDEERAELPPLFPRDLPQLRLMLTRLRPALVIIDPLLAFIDLAFSSINDQAVRQVLTPLALLVEEHDAAVVMIRHLNKTSGPKAIYRGSGSIGIQGAARQSFLVGVHPKDETARVLAPTKANLGDRPPAIAWRLVNHPQLTLHWLGEVEVTAEELVSPTERRTPLQRAESFLKTQLAEGPKPFALLLPLARGLGIALRTLERAKQTVGAQARRTEGHATEWFLPTLFGGPAEPGPPTSEVGGLA